MSQVSWSQIAEDGPGKWGVRVKTDGRCPYSPGDTVRVTNRKGEGKDVVLGLVHSRWNYGARTTVVVFRVAGGSRRVDRAAQRAVKTTEEKIDGLRAAYRAARAQGLSQDVLDNIAGMAEAVKAGRPISA